MRRLLHGAGGSSFRRLRRGLFVLEGTTKTYGEFFRDDTGAVTIDWVALTAGILLLGIMVVYAIFNGGVASLVGKINSTLSGVTTDVNTGATPDLNGISVASSGGGSGDGPMLLGDETSLPVGSEVTGFDGIGTVFTTPDGDTVSTAYGVFAEPVPLGITVSSSSTFDFDGQSFTLDGDGFPIFDGDPPA